MFFRLLIRYGPLPICSTRRNETCYSILHSKFISLFLHEMFKPVSLCFQLKMWQLKGGPVVSHQTIEEKGSQPIKILLTAPSLSAMKGNKPSSYKVSVTTILLYMKICQQCLRGDPKINDSPKAKQNCIHSSESHCIELVLIS